MDDIEQSGHKKIITIVVSIVVIIAIAFFVIYKQKGDEVVVPVAEQKVATSTAPKKTEFGANKPADFPTDIPVEKGIKFEQSYSLDYKGQKQLTIVFLSAKTVKENFTLYADFLKKQNWNLSKEYEGPKVSSLYGTKENNDINVTISGNTTIGSKSQVSISILKK